MLNENITVAWHTKEAILLHLLHSTSYTVRVAAFNDVDEGPYSEIIIETEGIGYSGTSLKCTSKHQLNIFTYNNMWLWRGL